MDRAAARAKDDASLGRLTHKVAVLPHRAAPAGVAIRADNGCSGRCVIQGNQVVGNTISGGGQNQAAPSFAVLLDYPYGWRPEWDSNNVSRVQAVMVAAGGSSGVLTTLYYFY
jgi:hypothetical protein